ncbi:MAG: glycoside hydrolase family 3 protein, partial [Desulfurococcaceae archaeon]
MSKVVELLNKLTMEEKISLLVGNGFSRIVPGAAGETRSLSRVGIPSIVLSDGPAGVRIHPLRLGKSETYYVTAFPNEIVLASTWNLELVEEVGKAIGEEAREYGVDILLAPALNMHRLPIGGRIFEYFSEDPVLAGKMASSYVRGVQSMGVGATLKHFVAHEQEKNRLFINVVVSERALREIYLRPFEIAIKESRPWAVMAAYNKLNNKYCSQNSWLLINVLREEWGFNGLVMTDWGAGDNPIEQVNSGVDLIMPGSDEIVKKLIDAYNQGLIPQQVIDERVRKILEVIERSLKNIGYKISNKPNLEEHSRIAYEAAIEGAVLLKNNNTLPIKEKSRIALFGKGSYWTVKGGLGSGDSYPRKTITISEGLRERGFNVDEEVENTYKNTAHRWYEYGESYQLLKSLREVALTEPNSWLIEMLMTHFIDMMTEYTRVINLQEDPFTNDQLDEIARRNDVAIITLSRISTEGFDRYPFKGDYYLRDDEFSLISRVAQAFHRYSKRVVVLLNIPGPIDLSTWRDLVDAILVIWLPGQEGGRAVADLLMGKISPSGKLPLTWPMDLYETPQMRTYPGLPRENPVDVFYVEDIYLGYRYYDTFS